eukprot:CAMPEP_0195293998 /NCGR_PEP_ID=MMETSP0707-20130614/13943_1 /TAXON_ID=33640 /ORGANISM="Asterionellopsis glacialis, Strain CCMP134" /LENGTH=932 /DNA_ID=CAMNT_0040354855 /DNA_START=29 /DNA_END=2824 /DNA_ORIENTATION=-
MVNTENSPLRPSELSELFEEPGESYSVPTGSSPDNGRTKSPDKRLLTPSKRTIVQLQSVIFDFFKPSTVIGSCVFLLYHLVFCMAQASAITRPNATGNSVGPLAKMASLGILLASPLFVAILGKQIPAIYPTSDLFLAPFLAQLAVKIDEELMKEGLQDDDAIFLATFTAVCSAAVLISGLLSILASVVKLANIGAFLPYSVLCGFFATIGILMYTLAFSIDTGGKKVGEVLFSNDPGLIFNSFLHHLPSVAIGVAMHVKGPQNPFYVLFLVAATIAGAYALLLVTGTTLEEAQQEQWFWSSTDLAYEANDRWATPAPFGVYRDLFQGKIHFGAVKAGFPTALALAFLYLVRCSLHAAALKKNIPNVTRKIELESPLAPKRTAEVTRPPMTPSAKSQIGNVSLQKILSVYGTSQIVASVTGGIAVAPAVAASMTLFKLGAEDPPPQYGSMVLLGIFHLTGFSLVCYIPKPAFSCLLVLAFLDMTKKWLIQSFHNTRKKTEWAVAPAIVLLAFSFGLLNAIFIGVGMSTFIFVASFYRSGVVKFLANGLSMRSTIERGVPDINWLDQNGDLIQICILQGYVFFGNAQSVLSYITTMFDEQEDYVSEFPLPPLPKFLIIDFTIVAGLDTSAIDLIREIITICRGHRCRLFLTGLEQDLKASLAYSGIKPSSTLQFIADVELALGRAEDGLLTEVCKIEEQAEHDAKVRLRSRSYGDDGFRFALRMIDQTHSTKFGGALMKLEPHTKTVELEPGDLLFQEDTSDSDRGFFFIEYGLLRVQRNTGFSVAGGSAIPGSGDVSIGHLNARASTLGREGAFLKSIAENRNDQGYTFRLSRLGVGWVVGSVEGVSGIRNPGKFIAVTPCRLHLLPYHRVQKLEKEDPPLILNLLKMISFLSAKRQEKTIEQLSNFFRMLNTPAPRTNGQIERRTLAALQN